MYAAADSRFWRNSKSVCGMRGPYHFIYGDDDANALLDALGIREVGRDELMLRPEILDIERAKRGEPPLTRLK